MMSFDLYLNDHQILGYPCYTHSVYLPGKISTLLSLSVVKLLNFEGEVLLRGCVWFWRPLVSIICTSIS